MRAVGCLALVLAAGCNALFGLDGVTVDDGDGGTVPDDGRGDALRDGAELPSRVRVPVCASPRALVAAAADTSNDLDLITACDTGISVVVSLGGRAYDSAQTVSLDGAAAVAAGDVNGDGIGDIAVANASSVNLYTGNGTGGFALLDSETMLGIKALAIGDLLSNDGPLDVAAAIGAGVLIYPGSIGGLGNPTSVVRSSTSGVALADLDFDGRPDLAIPADDDTLTVRRQAKNYDFDIARSVGGGAIAVGELVETTRDSLAVATIATAELGIVYATGGDILAGPRVMLPARATALATGDLNGDGLDDVAAILVDTKEVRVYANDGNRGLVASAVLPLDDIPSVVVVADLDDDNHDDVAVTLPALGEVWIYYGPL